MPHQTRHSRKTRKPKRTAPLGIKDPEVLQIHRELQVLRIAGGARPGTRRETLLAERMDKLSASEAAQVEPVEPSIPDLEAIRAINALPMPERLRAIKRHFS